MFQTFNLKELRDANPYALTNTPFEHQKDSFANLSKIFSFDSEEHKSGILVLPTGAGKTFTSINWICRNVIPKNVKVLWLAHTSHLLEQAFETFTKNILDIHSREFINIRVVSSNPLHSSAAKIDETDDVLIMTTQTAISNWDTGAVDGKGLKRDTNFERFIRSTKDTRLFLVLDEAHHAPAYGCRTLLVGDKKGKKGIRDLAPNSYFLGLTATPTYTDERRRGWLLEIYNTEEFDKKGIIFEVEKADLIKQDILAVPKYIQRNTGEEFEVSDKVFNHIVREHNDLPEDLIDKLAGDSARNDYIIAEYISNADLYKKTIIFADRWFQCVYLKEKLKAKGIRVDAVYSHIEPKGGTADKRNVRNAEENSLILKKFKSNELDVLINVKMLTEGTDVPDINTVFITRQTTSSILLTQMIGRALRGKKAGASSNKDVANIVFFTDNWKRLINFAIPDSEGGKDENEIKIRGRVPLQFISIKLIEDISKKIDNGLVFSDKEFLEQIPIGWYETDILVGSDQETNYFKEFTIVFSNTENKFKKFIQDIPSRLTSEWESEFFNAEEHSSTVTSWINEFFDSNTDNTHGTLDFDLMKIARHIAQSGKPPEFITFEDRNKHNLSQIAYDAVQKRMDDLSLDELLNDEYNNPNKLWKYFYNSYNRFTSAFDAERRRAIHLIKFKSLPVLNIPLPTQHYEVRELTEAEKEQVFRRDNYTCLCCGKYKGLAGHRVKLEVDHIVPFKFGGLATIENSQTLCSHCNKEKNINEINFRIFCTPLLAPKPKLELFDLLKSERYDILLNRIVNLFYHCHAVSEIIFDDRPRSKYQTNWEIKLFNGNDPKWLMEHMDYLIYFIKNDLKYQKLENITVTNA